MKLGINHKNYFEYKTGMFSRMIESTLSERTYSSVLKIGINSRLLNEIVFMEKII
jgi:hypothetical protein